MGLTLYRAIAQLVLHARAEFGDAGHTIGVIG